MTNWYKAKYALVFGIGIPGSRDFWSFFPFSRDQGPGNREIPGKFPGNSRDLDHFSNPDIPGSGFSGNFQTLVRANCINPVFTNVLFFGQDGHIF